MQVGTIMAIDDHVNMPGMAGFSPLRGDNDERWGARFPPLNNAYCMDRNASLLKCADDIGVGQVS
jgi:purine-nucleoside phosphorylase